MEFKADYKEDIIAKVNDKEFTLAYKKTIVEKDMIVMGDIYSVHEYRSKPVMAKFKNRKLLDEYDSEYCVGYICKFMYHEITPNVQNPVRKEEVLFCTVIGNSYLHELEDVYVI
jgi:hypothetical protein